MNHNSFQSLGNGKLCRENSIHGYYWLLIVTERYLSRMRKQLYVRERKKKNRTWKYDMKKCFQPMRAYIMNSILIVYREAVMLISVNIFEAYATFTLCISSTLFIVSAITMDTVISDYWLGIRTNKVKCRSQFAIIVTDGRKWFTAIRYLETWTWKNT